MKRYGVLELTLSLSHSLTHTHSHIHSNYPVLHHPYLPPLQFLTTLALVIYHSLRDSPPPPRQAMPILASHLRQRNSRRELTRTRIQLSSRICRTRGWCPGLQPGGNRYRAFHSFHQQISNLCHNRVRFQDSQAQCLE